VNKRASDPPLIAFGHAGDERGDAALIHINDPADRIDPIDTRFTSSGFEPSPELRQKWRTESRSRTIVMVHGSVSHTLMPASSEGLSVSRSLIHVSRVTSMMPSAP
jgi:hypothetical protein